MMGERGLPVQSTDLRVFNEERRCRLRDGEVGVSGKGGGDGEMEYDEALYEISDGGHGLEG
jgi:hypothetical protein